MHRTGRHMVGANLNIQVNSPLLEELYKGGDIILYKLLPLLKYKGAIRCHFQACYKDKIDEYKWKMAHY